MITISSGMAYPGGILSNLYPHRFVFDGVSCLSMESLLQSFKIENKADQIKMCNTKSFHAKSLGKNINWQKNQVLYWNNEPYKRESLEYYNLLVRAYETLILNNGKFRKALLDTGNEMLAHPIGGKIKRKTIITANEFCNILEDLRDKFKII